MTKAMNYAFILIFVLIVVAYFSGTVQVVGTVGDNVNRILGTLQGRKSDGNFASYPTGGQ